MNYLKSGRVLHLPVTFSSTDSLVYSKSSIITEQFNSPLSVTSNSVILTDCSISISTKHPVEQLQLNSLSDGGVGVTIHVKVRLDPAGNSKMSDWFASGTLMTVTE